MDVRTSCVLVKLGNSVSEEHLQWMQVVCQYALDIPWVKVEATTSFIDLYELVEESVTASEAPSLMVKILRRLCIACPELQACETLGAHKNNRKLEFVLTLLDIIRDLPEEHYESFLTLARRRYFDGYHKSKFYPRSRLIRLLLDRDFISTTNFGIVYVFLESIHNSRQHAKLDIYCEEQCLDKPDWRALCVQTDPSSFSERSDSFTGEISSCSSSVTPIVESGASEQVATGLHVLVTGYKQDGDSENVILEGHEYSGPPMDLSIVQQQSTGMIQQVRSDGPVAPRPSSLGIAIVSDINQNTSTASSASETESSFSNGVIPESPCTEIHHFKRTFSKTLICLAVLVLLFFVCLVGTLVFAIGPHHISEEQYIGGNVAVLLHPAGFDQLFVKSVEVTGHVTRRELESECTFFFTPCDTLQLSPRQFSNKSLGTFRSPVPTIISLNYFQSDEPILSQGQKGKLTYYTTAQSNHSYSQCPVIISIFDNEKDYNNYRNKVSQKTTNQSTCLLQNFLSDQPATTLTESTFDLQSGQFYFVLLSMEAGVSVSVSVMVTVTEYNVSHLQPLSCRLGYDEATNEQCIFALSNSSFHFLSHKKCLLGLSFSQYSAPYFNVSLTTTPIHVETPYFIVFSILDASLLITIVLVCPGLYFRRLCMRRSGYIYRTVL